MIHPRPPRHTSSMTFSVGEEIYIVSYDDIHKTRIEKVRKYKTRTKVTTTGGAAWVMETGHSWSASLYSSRRIHHRDPELDLGYLRQKARFALRRILEKREFTEAQCEEVLSLAAGVGVILERELW